MSEQVALPTIACREVVGTMQIDGRLDEPAWRAAEHVGLDLNAGGQPRCATSVAVLWDPAVLYIGFKCEDPDPKGSMTQRDDPIWEDGNVVEVFLDPAGEGRSFYEFEVNPINTLLDLFFEDRDQHWKQARRWDAQRTQTAVDIQKSPDDKEVIGWSVEIAIPFENFHTAPQLPPSPDDCWRVNFYRYNTLADLPGDGQELSAWSSTLVGKFDVPERFGFMRFC